MPAAGRRTQLFILIFSEPGVCGFADPCTLYKCISLYKTKSFAKRTNSFNHRSAGVLLRQLRYEITRGSGFRKVGRGCHMAVWIENPLLVTGGIALSNNIIHFEVKLSQHVDVQSVGMQTSSRFSRCGSHSRYCDRDRPQKINVKTTMGVQHEIKII